jgi:hypothetical protein
MITDPYYDSQERLIDSVVKQCIERFLPAQGIQSSLVYRLPISSLDKAELERLKSTYDSQSVLSKTKIGKLEVVQPVQVRGGFVERVLIEILHVSNDVIITSFNFLYDDLAIWMAHKLENSVNLTVEVRNPEKVFKRQTES